MDISKKIDLDLQEQLQLEKAYSRGMTDHAGIKATRVRIYDSNGNIVNEGHNKVILSGAEFAVSKYFEPLSRAERVTPTYNNALGLDNTLDVTATSPEYVYLFCIGTSGCGKDPSQVYESRYEEWTKPEDLVPFLYVDKDNDIIEGLRNTYFGRRESGTKTAYYFKKPENMDNPDYIRQYVDGTPVDSNVFNNNRSDRIITMVQLNMKVLKNEGRSFFRNTTGINTSRMNTLSLCTAWPKLIDGHIYYQNIRPLTRYNFPSISLIDSELGYDVKYDLFF